MNVKLKLSFLLFLGLYFSFAMSGFAKDSFVFHQSFKGPKGKVYGGALSPDGRYVVMIDKRRTIRVWSYANGRQLKAIKPGTHRPLVIAFHPKKNLLFTGGQDGKINIWDIRKGQRVQTLDAKKGPVKTLSISKDGELLASGGKSNMIVVWRLDRYKMAKKILEPTGEVVSIDWHPNNRLIGWSNGNGEVKVWDTKSGILKGSHKLHRGKVFKVKFHPQGAHIVSAGGDKKVIFWDFKKKKTAKTIVAGSGGITGFDFDARGKSLLTCSLDENIKVWDLRKDKVKDVLKLVNKPVLGCQFANAARSILGVFENTYLRGWNLGDNGYLATLKGHKKSIISLDVSSSSRFLLSLSSDSELKLWDIRKMKTVKTYKIPKGHHPICVKFSPKNKLFATCGSNSEVLVWDRDSGVVKFALKGKHKGKITSLDFSRAENQLISAGADKKIVVWDLKSKRSLFQKQVHQGQINKVRYSEKGDIYVTGSADKTAKVFRSFDNQLLFTLKGASRGIRSVQASRSKDLIATVSDDTTIRLYSQVDGSKRGELRGHEFIITDVNFSPSGRALVTASRDKTVKLWDGRKSKFIRTLTGQDHQVTAMAVERGGDRMFVGTLNGEINVLRLPKKVFGVRTKRVKAIEKMQEANALEVQALESIEAKEPVKKEFSAVDVAEEQAGLQRDSVFDPPTVFVDQELLALKQNLNRLLKERNTCQNSDELESSALKVLVKNADDQSAFYALLQVYALRHDIQSVYLMAKLGIKATFFTGTYDYSDPVKIRRFFKVWNDEVFNLSVVEGADLRLEFIDCKNNILLTSLPKELLYFEVPDEVVKPMLSGQLTIDFNYFTALSNEPEVFKDRLFGLIAGVVHGERHVDSKTIKKYIPLGKDSGYGTLHLDLTKIEQFGDRKRIKFQLKRGSMAWMSFVSDTDQTKSLLLPKGEYYLRVNNKLKRAFVVKKDQIVHDKIN